MLVLAVAIGCMCSFPSRRCLTWDCVFVSCVLQGR
uniref:Uncharacterized protein n=1 Tax=Arundo donax TaxID=35708 RepID=A0A0A9BXH2_ARUDO